MTSKTLLAGILLSALLAIMIAAFGVPKPAAAAADLVIAQAQGGGSPGMMDGRRGPGGDGGGPGMMEGQRGPGGPGMMEGRRGPGGPGRAQQMFEAMDTDKDGAISAEEFKTAHQTEPGMFAVLDADGDGTVSQEEFVNPRQTRREARFKDLDTNQDGQLSEDEYSEHVAQMFEAMDEDGDGKLTMQEMGPPPMGRQQQ